MMLIIYNEECSRDLVRTNKSISPNGVYTSNLIVYYIISTFQTKVKDKVTTFHGRKLLILTNFRNNVCVFSFLTQINAFMDELNVHFKVTNCKI